MDRPKLEKVSLVAPGRTFLRVASKGLLNASDHEFLLDHVGELDVDVLATIFKAERGPELEFAEKRFVRRLAHLVPSAETWQVLEILRLANKITAHAWIEDLTLPLRAKLPNYVWYRFVDKARGGEIFNALNSGMPRPADSTWNPDEYIVESIEKERAEPVVVALLDRAHDDLAAAEFALQTQPIPVLFYLHAKFPKLINHDAIRAAVPDRVRLRSQTWVPTNGAPTFPEWMAPFVIERLHHCDDQEAHSLFEWVSSLPIGVDAFHLAMMRFELALSQPAAGYRDVDWWSRRIGEQLSTGSAWKKLGSCFVARCIGLGKGFPPATLQAALAAAAKQDGASAEEHRQSILSKAHDVTARLLVDRAEAALKEGDFSNGDLFLSALMSLDPGSFIRGALHHVSKIPGLPPALTARIEGCQDLAGAARRQPTEDAFYEAFLVLTRQVS